MNAPTAPMDGGTPAFRLVREAVADLRLDPAADTSHLEGLCTYDPQRDSPEYEETIPHKAEHDALAMFLIERVGPRFVDCEGDPREASFTDLMHDTGEDLLFLEQLGADVKKTFSTAAAEVVLETGVLGPAIDRFNEISAPFAEVDGAGDFMGIFEQGAVAVENLVVNGYLPFIKNLIRESSWLDASTEVQRRIAIECVDFIMNLSMLNQGHLDRIMEDKVWGTIVGVDATLVHEDSGEFHAQIPRGSRPPKPKDNLMSDTLQCPARGDQPRTEKDSVLDRIVYATVNEAYNRGYFGVPSSSHEPVLVHV